MVRRVIIALGQESCAAGEAHAEIYHGITASEALGRWCYHNRKSLGLRLDLLTANGELITASD